jgi:hypothetical protein
MATNSIIVPMQGRRIAAPDAPSAREGPCVMTILRRGTLGPSRGKQELTEFAASAVQPVGRAGRRVPTIVQEVLREPGEPLSATVRACMEAYFGLDLGRVRIHAGARAAVSAAAVQARAYTVGRHIAFGQGEYSPTTLKGLWLLAHELTHVLQQSQADLPALARVAFAQEKSRFEGEANRLAGRLVLGPVPRPGRRRPLRVRRSPLALQRSNYFPPSDWLTQLAAQIVGTRLAEIAIRNHYAQVMLPWDPPNRDWFDGSGTNAYFEIFLGGNNPSFRPHVDQVKKEFANGGIQLPDIISHKPDRKEYYEIKPDSSFGVADGQAKLLNLSEFYKKFKLPYDPGVQYKSKIPTGGIEINGTIFGGVFKAIFDRFQQHLVTFMGEQLRTNCNPTIRLRWKLLQDGLITYRLGVTLSCQEMDIKAVKKYILAAFLMAVDPALWPEVAQAITQIIRIEIPLELQTFRPIMERQIRMALVSPRAAPQDYLILAEHALYIHLRDKYVTGPGAQRMKDVTDWATIKQVPGGHIAAVPADKAVNLYWRATEAALVLDYLALAGILAFTGAALTAATAVVETVPQGLSAAGGAGLGSAGGGGLLATEGAAASPVSAPVVANGIRTAVLQYVGNWGGVATTDVTAVEEVSKAAGFIGFFGSASLRINEARAGTTPAFAPNQISTLRALPAAWFRSTGRFTFGDLVQPNVSMGAAGPAFSPAFNRTPASQELFYVGGVTVDTPPWKEDGDTET